MASRSAVAAGSALARAAGRVRHKAMQAAAAMLEAAEDDLRMEDGEISVAGSPQRSVSRAAVARALLLDYLLPTTTDMPPLAVDHVERPSPLNPLGVKGLGEGGAIPPPAAIANAVEDALGGGVVVRRTPVTPSSVIELLRGLMDRFLLPEAVAAVTGASRGIGRAIAVGLAEAGAAVLAAGASIISASFVRR